MSSGWSDKTSKRKRKKKVQKLHGKSNIESDKKKKKSPRKRRTDDNNDYDENYDENYILTDEQYQISRQISSLLPNYKLDRIQCKKIITNLGLRKFNPYDDRMKAEVLNEIVSELQNAMTMSGKSQSKAAKKMNNNNNPKSKNGENLNLKNNKNKSSSKQQQQQKQRENKNKKKGNFMEILDNAGSVFFDFIDNETISNLIRIDQFSFILKNQKILTPKQRLKVYTSNNDISFRIRSFNAKLSTASSLKLYELRKVAKHLEINDILNIIALNALNLHSTFTAKYEKHPMIAMDLTLNKNIANKEFMQKIIAQKCKQFNIWRATNITDLNEAYLSEFDEYQQSQNISRVKDGSFGPNYLENLNTFILNDKLLTKENRKSLHFGYIKSISNYQLRSYLFIFIQLKNIKKDVQPFIVWYGQCG